MKVSFSVSSQSENFAKLYLSFQKLDHLKCNAILRINQNEGNGFIHVIGLHVEERHK